MTLNPGQRFAEVFQIDPDHPGTPIQRQAVYDSLTAKFGDPWHRLLQRLDRAVNATGRTHLTIGFHHGMLHPGLASRAGFNLSAAMGYDGCFEVAGHETGHLIDFWLLTEADREWFMEEMARDSWPGAWEAWAEAVREWKGGGWKALTPILLPDPADPPARYV